MRPWRRWSSASFAALASAREFWSCKFCAQNTTCVYCYSLRSCQTLTSTSHGASPPTVPPTALASHPHPNRRRSNHSRSADAASLPPSSPSLQPAWAARRQAEAEEVEASRQEAWGCRRPCAAGLAEGAVLC